MKSLVLNKREVRGHTDDKQPHRLELLHPLERHKAQHHIRVFRLNSCVPCSRDFRRLLSYMHHLGNCAFYLLANWLSPKENKLLYPFESYAIWNWETILKLEAQVSAAIDLGLVLSKDTEGQKHQLP